MGDPLGKIAELRKQATQLVPDTETLQYKTWRRDMSVFIARTFGEKSKYVGDFDGIRFIPMVYPYEPGYDIKRFEDGRTSAIAMLDSMAREITEYGLASEFVGSPREDLGLVFKRFHAVARQLRDRRENRAALEIEDEYDVQYLLHALLRLYFDDIRPEEWTPSYAGGSSRMDFLLKKEEVVVEVKKTRKGLDSNEIGKQLIVDIARYKSHPSCKSLLCFVYDPEARLPNPAELTNDLSRVRDGLAVEVIIAPAY